VAAVSGSNNTQFNVSFTAQTAPGSYHLVVGPNILDTYGNQMDQNLNGINGEVPADQYSTNFSVSPSDGAHVTSSSVMGSTTSVNGMRVTFNESINPSTFTPSQITLTGPTGAAITVIGVAAVSGSNNTQFNVTFAPQTTLGTYHFVLGPNVPDMSGNQMDQNQNGINGEVPADQYPTSFAVSSVSTFSSGDVPKPIVGGQTAISNLVISQSMTIADVNVQLNITESSDKNLTITLHSPAGTVITLSNRRGANGHNFTNTIFDDQALVAISAGSAPFAGSYRPDSPLSPLNGQNASGTWQLWVQDQAPHDQGTLNSWSLIITGAATAAGTATGQGTESGGGQAGMAAAASTDPGTQPGAPVRSAVLALGVAPAFASTVTVTVPSQLSSQATSFTTLDPVPATPSPVQGQPAVTTENTSSKAAPDWYWIAAATDPSPLGTL
jgi:subtilisin-like proprotein convertase family protein